MTKIVKYALRLYVWGMLPLTNGLVFLAQHFRKYLLNIMCECYAPTYNDLKKVFPSEYSEYKYKFGDKKPSLEYIAFSKIKKNIP